MSMILFIELVCGYYWIYHWDHSHFLHLVPLKDQAFLLTDGKILVREMRRHFWMTNSCFCFGTSGSLSNPPQEKAQLKWHGRSHRLFPNHLVKTDLVIENKAHLLKRKKFQSPQMKPLTPWCRRSIPRTVYKCRWFRIWVNKAGIFLARAIERHLAYHGILSVWDLSSQPRPPPAHPLNPCPWAQLRCHPLMCLSLPQAERQLCGCLMSYGVLLPLQSSIGNAAIRRSMGENRMANYRADRMPEIGHKT